RLRQRNGEGISLIGLGNAYNLLGQYQRAIEFYQQSLEISREIGDRNGEGHSLSNLGNAYYQCGRTQEGFAASYQAQKIFQELELPLEAMPYPHWLKSLIKLAQRGHLQLILCFIFGLIAFPFALIWLILPLLWPLIRAQFRR
ncbi:MAG: tetratricopeptide repeat protein, partial [Nostoc sp.]|uniref:tetratricopeptide repeat protein n=1 Tax=Nostoc sp. TaxID=1180 RepID=UPI002FF54D86